MKKKLFKNAIRNMEKALTEKGCYKWSRYIAEAFRCVILLVRFYPDDPDVAFLIQRLQCIVQKEV